MIWTMHCGFDRWFRGSPEHLCILQRQHGIEFRLQQLLLDSTLVGREKLLGSAAKFSRLQTCDILRQPLAKNGLMAVEFRH